jgi:hypothetical protein
MQRIALAAAALLAFTLQAAAQDADSTAKPGLKNPPVATRDDAVKPGATKPSPGKNSFTESQAKGRIEKHGYDAVADLHKDQDDVWHARAKKKDGRDVTVALDWMGNVIEGR